MATASGDLLAASLSLPEGAAFIDLWEMLQQSPGETRTSPPFSTRLPGDQTLLDWCQSILFGAAVTTRYTTSNMIDYENPLDFVLALSAVSDSKRKKAERTLSWLADVSTNPESKPYVFTTLNVLHALNLFILGAEK